MNEEIGVALISLCFTEANGGVEQVEVGVMHRFAYRVVGSEEEEVIVATTRPESIVADEAVAVHSSDDRYAHLVGHYVKHPFLNKKLPVIADDVLVDRTLGTGAVKVVG